MGLPLLRALCLAGARVMKDIAAPRLGALLQQDVGLIRKTAIIPPHAPRPCLPVWPCLGHAWPRVLPVTTLHGDGLLGRAARRFVKNKKKEKRPKMVCTSYLRSSFGVKTPEALFGARSTEAWDRRVYRLILIDGGLYRSRCLVDGVRSYKDIVNRFGFEWSGLRREEVTWVGF